MSEMLSLEEAWERLLALAPKRHAALIGLMPFAPTRYLADDIAAQRTQPPADLSAMDGYALAPGDGPWTLAGESRAGAPFEGTLDAGQCVRISTGATMPKGADRVLIQENAKVEKGVVAASEQPIVGAHIRKAGFDFEFGDVVLTKGTRLNASVLALAAASGQQYLPLIEPPAVAVLDSGDELVPAGEPCEPHQIPASNGLMIGAMLHPYVGLVESLGPVPDDAHALAAALKRSEGSHILITSGGASVGDHDLMQQALKDWGAEIDFWKVAIKPGKPLMVATRGDQVIIGLPGNPVSSFVTCFLFALPLIRASMGATDPLPKHHTLTAAEDLPATVGRREFLRGYSDGAHVRLAGSQDSSALRSLAASNCLIDRPANAPVVRAGEPVTVYNLQNG